MTLPTPAHPAPQEGDSLRLSDKLYYGIGAASEGTKNTVFNVFLLFYYNNVLGLPGTMTGAAIFIALCVDAVTDPLMGSISDNFHSRWGRRHPFMYASAAPMALCFFLLMNPPEGLGQTPLFLWLTACAIGVRVSMTLYSIPSGSMVAELTSDYDERTSLVSFRLLFAWMSGLTASQLGYLYFFAPSEQWSDGRLDPNAYGAFGATCAAIIFLSILACAAGTHRLIPRLNPPPEKTPLTFHRFWGELSEVLGNRSYLMLLGAAFFASAAGGFNDVIGLYVNTYFWGLSTNQLAILLLGLVLATVIAFAATAPVTRHYDKKTIATALAGFAIFVGPLPTFLRLLEWMPANGSPLLLPILMVHITLVVAAIVSIGIILPSMIADVVDENELHTGKRQEGMFASAIAFTGKATSGVGGLAAGIALDLIAFPRGSDVISVPPEKIFQLGLAVGPGLMLFYIATLIFLSRYRLDRERHAQILAELALRRSGANHGNEDV